MADLFSPEWMQAFGEQWNAEPELADALAKIHFNSTIGYGFDQDANPLGVITIQEGRVVAAGKYAGQQLNWDLRAERKHWDQWQRQGLNMLELSMAYRTHLRSF